MFGRRPQAPLSAAQLLSLHVQQAAVEFEREKEELETLQIMFRGAVAFAADCESRARLRGSPATHAFRLVGQATQALGVGTDKVAASLPPPSAAALRAVGTLLGLDRAAGVDDEAEAEVPAGK